MDVLFKGVVNVAGTHDSGKSVFSQECGAQPEDMVYFDHDLKARDFVAQLARDGKKLGYYADLVTITSGKKEVETHDLCLQEVMNVEKLVSKDRKGKVFEALIWDTWTPFEMTLHPYVMTFPSKFRTYWSPNGLFKGAEQWKSAFKYEAEIIDRLLNVANMVILTSHLKPHAINGRKTGKMIPDVKQPVTEKSMLRAYLMPSGEGQAPIGLVLKRIAKSMTTPMGIRTTSVLPRRMEPFTWDEIRRYWNDPVGNRKLLPTEKPNEFELSILDDTLTEEQKEILKLQPVIEEEEETVFPAETIEKVKQMFEEGKPKPVIAKALDLTVPDVVKILGA